jgi:hypothetical protein
VVEQIAVAGGPVLNALIRVEQTLIGSHLPTAEGPVDGLDHQGGIHAGIQSSAKNGAAEQIDPGRVLTPAGRCADCADDPA